MFFALVITDASSHAVSIPLSLPLGVGVKGSGYVTKVGAKFSGGSVNGSLTARVAGKVVLIPMKWTMTSTAGRVVSTALRTNPGLAAVSTLGWLLLYGIDRCVNGTWCRRNTVLEEVGYFSGPYSTFFLTRDGGYATQYASAVGDMVNIVKNHSFGVVISSVKCEKIGEESKCTVTYHIVDPKSGPGWRTPDRFAYFYEDKNLGFLNKALIPDDVATELVENGVEIPLQPEVNLTPQIVQMSDPFVDPADGKRYQEVAVVTPASDLKTANLKLEKQEVKSGIDSDLTLGKQPVVNSNSGPVTSTSPVVSLLPVPTPIVDPISAPIVDPRPTHKQEKPIEADKPLDDPCILHPNRLGCMSWGDTPSGPDLKDISKNISIIPDFGWGPESASCPADLTTHLRIGSLVAFSFKPVCDAATMFRPAVISVAWMTAVLIALGVGKSVK